LVEFASVPSASTWTTAGRPAPTCAPYPGGMPSAIHAVPRSSHRSTSLTLVTVPTIVK
jgi:hypothetical protein